ncbi:uncharacterized protein LOC118737790 [Rhagoletis pomonella]|uniref:uncharacterized protein LOC118737790 n=1 Tax=Rhagoletis pomonella TaxID=28610 RepID=UPI00177B657E|nr:uncharacterized protein LOC118737790 [Rhagoletis pomonella]
MKVIQLLLSIMLALMLVAPTVFAQVYTVPTAAPTPPTINPTTAGAATDDGPPSASSTPSPASVSTEYPLYGTTS